jgi:hypothetical protein
LILAKYEEMQKEREENQKEHQNLSLEERKAKMEERRAELEKWASDNGIDVKYLFGLGGGERHGMGMGKGIRNNK